MPYFDDIPSWQDPEAWGGGFQSPMIVGPQFAPSVAPPPEAPPPEAPTGLRGFLSNQDKMGQLGALGQGLLASSGWSNRRQTFGEGLARGMALMGEERDKQAAKARQDAYDALQKSKEARMQKAQDAEDARIAIEMKQTEDAIDGAASALSEKWGMSKEQAAALVRTKTDYHYQSQDAAPRPEGLVSVAPGNTLVNRNTLQPVFTAPPRAPRMAAPGRPAPAKPSQDERDIGKAFDQQVNQAQKALREMPAGASAEDVLAGFDMGIGRAARTKDPRERGQLKALYIKKAKGIAPSGGDTSPSQAQSRGGQPTPPVAVWGRDAKGNPVRLR